MPGRKRKEATDATAERVRQPGYPLLLPPRIRRRTTGGNGHPRRSATCFCPAARLPANTSPPRSPPNSRNNGRNLNERLAQTGKAGRFPAYGPAGNARTDRSSPNEKCPDSSSPSGHSIGKRSARPPLPSRKREAAEPPYNSLVIFSSSTLFGQAPTCLSTT